MVYETYFYSIFLLLWKLYKSELTGSFVLVPVICETWVSIIVTEMQVNICPVHVLHRSLRFQLPSSEDIWLVWNTFVVFNSSSWWAFLFPYRNQSSFKCVLRFVSLCQPFHTQRGTSLYVYHFDIWLTYYYYYYYYSVNKSSSSESS